MIDPTQANAEIDHARELCKRIDAMINAPYWTSERRTKIGECARKAQAHLDKATACLTTEHSSSPAQEELGFEPAPGS